MKTLGYGFRQGIKNIWQNRLFSLAAIGTIATCLFLLGIFYALVSNFQNMVHSAEGNVGVTVFFDEGLSEDRITAIGREIEGWDSIKEVTYVSAEEAWERFQKEMYGDDGTLTESFNGENPLKDSASYEVYVNDVAKQADVVKKIKKIDGVRKVNSSGTVAGSLSSFNALVAYVSATIILLLLLVSVFLISTAVATGIRVRKDEIAIMQYIGATNAFVRLPFIVEGIVIGIVGAAIPLALLRLVYGRVVSFILQHFSSLSQWLTFVSPSEEFRVLAPLSLAVGVGIGLVGSAVSVRKHFVN